MNLDACIRRRGEALNHSGRILVTGANGFIGSAVVRALARRGIAPRVLVRPGSDRRNLEGYDVEIAEGDLCERPSLDQALKGVSVLYHLAADYRLWMPDPSCLYRVNVEGTASLMQAALDAGVERIVYTSSVAALGINQSGEPADEETPVCLEDMIGHYKRSKFLAEERVRALIENEGLPAVIVNPSAPIGPYDIKPTPTGRLITQAAKGAMPAYVDTGLNLAHVDDIAEGHLLAYEKGQIGERYILGGDNLTLSQILQQIAELTGRKAPWVKLPHALLWPLAFGAENWARLRKQEKEPFITMDGLKMSKKLMFFSHRKAGEALGYQPRCASLALADAVNWFRENNYLA